MSKRRRQKSGVDESISNYEKSNKPPVLMPIPDPDEWFLGTVEWFDAGKGYGLVHFSSTFEDAYLSKRILEDLQISTKKSFENLAVRVQLMRGRKINTIEVAAIAFRQPLSTR